MAALQRDICGGKLVGKAGGVFECEYCGMKYAKTWACFTVRGERR